MLKPRTYGLLLLLGWLLAGCSAGSQSEETLTRAASLVAEAPDSALYLLRSLQGAPFRSRAQHARYALLYAEAAERAEVAENNDSLLRIAWEYYREHPNEIRAICKTRYYQGRSRLRQGDKPGALRMFLKVEEQLRTIDEPYYLGLLYLRIGGVYRTELNFVTAYRYYRDARDLFMRSESPRQTTEALLGMSVSALRMHDLGRARRDCAMALDLADDLADDTLVRRSLGLFATLYTLSENERIPNDLLLRVERSIRGDTSAAGRCTLAQTQLFRNRPDSARHYLRLAEMAQPDNDVWPMIEYTAYRVEARAGNYREAARKIDGFIRLNDSLTRTALQTSASMVEKEYFRERAAFADYRMQSRRVGERVVAGTVLLLLGIAGFLVRQRMRLHRERDERHLLLIREAEAEYRNLARNLAQRDLAEARLKGIIASRFDIVDRLGKTLYERENTATGQAAMTREVKRLIDGFAENGEMLQELEQIVDMAHDEVMQKLRRNFPRMKEADVRLLCYIFGGFSPQVISLFMEESVANVYARKSRLKSRIKASDAPDRELFLSLLGPVSEGC
ncbi:MAG TPA: hypothetical protein H9828_03155 [Candidatus Alistipes intestinigallinarum]|uniref:Tetratricopeptide repeat protein n=1 Tax=Candidatus Alistipes intestinigallinarum TaxID=2838440 RepID=A0A9D1Z013_9BACT|nr:hypothetical protein [Candidatus Alistipes intestinigallinarum]